MPERRIDRVVLLSLVPADRWTEVSEIAAQLGATSRQVGAALADAIADGERVDVAGTRYRRYADGEDAEPAPIGRSAQRQMTASDASRAFGRVVSSHRVALGLSQNKLARGARIDPAYVNRIERGTSAGQPSRHVVLSLAETLELDGPATDRLLFVAGLAPARDYQAIAEETMRRLALVQEALAEPALSELASRMGLGPLAGDAGRPMAVRRVG